LIEAVFFDCDGVIIDSMPVHADAWVGLFGRYGIAITPEDVYLEEGRNIIDFCQLILNRNGHAGKLSAHELAHEKEELVISEKKITVFPEIPNVLAEVRAGNVKLGMVTGSNLKLIESVIPQAIFDLFDVVVTADDVQNGKPAPDPYLCAAKKLRVHPESCLVVENAPMGIQAAKAAGMQAIGITTTLSRRHLSQADEVVENFQELREALKSKLRIVVENR
jgi:beta-phosphoglucomutase